MKSCYIEFEKKAVRTFGNEPSSQSWACLDNFPIEWRYGRRGVRLLFIERSFGGALSYHQGMTRVTAWPSPFFGVLTALLAFATPTPAAATVYYVSASSGNDGAAGTSPGAPFRTLAKVNGLALLPGDQVRLFCGEIWRADPLIVTRSGSSGSPITFTSHPLGCAEQPTLTGAWPVAGWAAAGPSLWVTDLDLGANAGRFSGGARQVFRGGARLGIGRWPNLLGGPNGDGYATIDAEPAAARLQDAELPAGSWVGARVHAKGIRWYIVNRDVVAQAGATLTLNDDLACIGTADCAGWGYFLSNHLLTLDREGEWYWEAATNRLFLFSAGPPADGEIEATTVVDVPGNLDAGVVLGRHLQNEIAYVTVENLRVERFHDAGIGFPENLELDENHHLSLIGNTIEDVESTGIRLATWVWNAGANSGWRGGHDLLVENNVIVGANHFGIDGYSFASTFRGNTLRDIGRIEELAASGLGCGITGSNCTENGDGFRLRLSTARNAHDNQISRNVFENVGMNGLDVFGYRNTVEENIFRDICITKGDCGAIRTFGRDNLASTQVYEVTLRRNLVRGVEGNTDGCHPSFAARLGIGLYLDNFSRDLTVEDNLVEGASWVGLLFQNATGSATGNVLYGNASEPWGTQWGSQLDLRGNGVTSVAQSGNALVGLAASRFSLTTEAAGLLSASNGNFFWNPFYAGQHIRRGGTASGLAGWRSATGFDLASVEQGYTQAPGEEPRTRLLVNENAANQPFPTPAGARDLAGALLVSPLVLAPFSAQVMVVPEALVFADGFETGSTAAWSLTSP